MSEEACLVRIDQKLDDLIKAFDKVSNGTGFPRCEARRIRIEGVEKGVDNVRKESTWLKRILIMGICAVILEGILMRIIF